MFLDIQGRPMIFVTLLSTENECKYVKDGITSWIHNWKVNNWKNSQKKDVKNKDLWQELDGLAQKLDIDWKWVKGHSGNIENDIADELATSAIKNV